MPIFSNYTKRIKDYTNEILDKRAEEKKQDEEYDRQLVKEENRNLTLGLKERAREHARQKAEAVLNNPRTHLAHKLKAINENYKEVLRPKETQNALQEMSDRMAINRFKRDMRMQRIAEIKRAVQEDKIRRINERREQQEQFRQRNELMKLAKQAKNNLQKVKLNLRKSG